MLLRAFEAQERRAGFSFVEILTMCPTGWFVETEEAPGYLEDNLAAVHTPGVLKDEARDVGERRAAVAVHCGTVG